MQVLEIGGAFAPLTASEIRNANLAKARAAKKPKPADISVEKVIAHSVPAVPPKPTINKKLIMLEWRSAKTNDQSESAQLKPARQCRLEGYSIAGQDFSPEFVDVALVSGKTGKRKVPCNLQGIFFDGSDIEDNNFTDADCRWSSFRGCDPEKLKNNIWENTDLRGAVTASGKTVSEGGFPAIWE